MGYFQTYVDKSGSPRFKLKAGNHQVILASEGYSSTAARDNGIKSVQKNSGDEKRYEAKKAKNGEHYFVLKAGNGEVIGSSEMYTTIAACKKGMKSVMTNGSSTTIKAE